jgi:putative peptidoglycan lipid II flippase
MTRVLRRFTGGQAGPAYHATLVALGILLSRVAGLVRDRVFAHYFGSSDAADAFRAAFRIPNLLQNLFGEGALSASFIPVYANLLARREKDEADNVASAVFCLLALSMSCLVAAGVFATPAMTALIAPGFKGAKLDLTIGLVRILFPGAGILVISAWCLGVLNSHRRFFMSYAAPVAWNAMMIASLLCFGGRLGEWPLATVLAWGSVAGSTLQLLVQLPQVLRLVGRLRPILGLAMESVRTVVRNFLPMLVSRGVVQISAYVDTILASFLPTGALAALVYAQTLYLMPVSLFGMSVSAAELPAFSSALGDEREVGAYLRGRLDARLRRIAFFVVPSAMAFFALGDVVAGAIYQTGRFGRADSV